MNRWKNGTYGREGNKTHSVGRIAHQILLRTLILLGGTVLVSLAYKGMIEIGVFRVVQEEGLHYFVFCLFELLLLGVYWHFLFLFSKKCRHRSESLARYYRISCAVFILFCAAYWLTYFLGGRAVFMWGFRVTVNLIAFRLVSTAPENLVPYMIAYLAVTFAVMMLEPYIARKRYEKWMKALYGEV